MRIVVVGATGNVGTAVLRRLHSAPEVTEIVGVARRLPDDTAEPYAGVTWHGLDIGDDTSAARLEPLFRGADAIIHLAWALQPNHNEPAMRRVNVGGTANVMAAVAAASVAQLVVASSVGAYSFGPKRSRVDETWPTGGIPTSHYARYKAANERALDTFEDRHPDIIVTRLRPGLIFQRDAGRELTGLFLKRIIPTKWLTSVKLPVLPLPSQVIFQAVHARDVADAFWRSIDRRAGGAFNIAAEPVLDPTVIASVMRAGSTVPFRAAVLRRLVDIAWRLRVINTDPGWLDIATTVPIMSTARARDVLGWTPTVSATDALAEIIRGMADHEGIEASASLSG